jgi:hypothetical protein
MISMRAFHRALGPQRESSARRRTTMHISTRRCMYAYHLASSSVVSFSTAFAELAALLAAAMLFLCLAFRATASGVCEGMDSMVAASARQTAS